MDTLLNNEPPPAPSRVTAFVVVLVPPASKFASPATDITPESVIVPAAVAARLPVILDAANSRSPLSTMLASTASILTLPPKLFVASVRTTLAVAELMSVLPAMFRAAPWITPLALMTRLPVASRVFAPEPSWIAFVSENVTFAALLVPTLSKSLPAVSSTTSPPDASKVARPATAIVELSLTVPPACTSSVPDIEDAPPPKLIPLPSTSETLLPVTMAMEPKSLPAESRVMSLPAPASIAVVPLTTTLPLSVTEPAVASRKSCAATATRSTPSDSETFTVLPAEERSSVVAVVLIAFASEPIPAVAASVTVVPLTLLFPSTSLSAPDVVAISIEPVPLVVTLSTSREPLLLISILPLEVARLASVVPPISTNRMSPAVPTFADTEVLLISRSDVPPISSCALSETDVPLISLTPSPKPLVRSLIEPPAVSVTVPLAAIKPTRISAVEVYANSVPVKFSVTRLPLRSFRNRLDELNVRVPLGSTSISFSGSVPVGATRIFPPISPASAVMVMLLAMISAILSSS